jgi:hypothetical protein
LSEPSAALIEQIRGLDQEACRALNGGEKIAPLALPDMTFRLKMFLDL